MLKMDKDLYAFNICRKCKRKDWIPFSKEDIDDARNNGGLFTKILDHDDHIIILKIDSNGAVRREYIIADMQNVQQIIS
jgi:hypothetical protein